MTGGRRPGESGTRDAILAAARLAFGRQGYGATSVRAVARAAGVDPSLVLHFFGSKDGLFEAALQLPADQFYPDEYLVYHCYILPSLVHGLDEEKVSASQYLELF